MCGGSLVGENAASTVSASKIQSGFRRDSWLNGGLLSLSGPSDAEGATSAKAELRELSIRQVFD